MAYRSSEKTRQKKDAKRTAMMQAAVKVFSEKGYHAATVRDVVESAGVAIGTFYFYFPDKETLFLYLYEETADFLLQSLQQAVVTKRPLPQRLTAGLQSYVNISLYEPAVTQLLLAGGLGSVPSLQEKQAFFRERLIGIWQQALLEGVDRGEIPAQDTRYSAEFLAGGFDQIILNLLRQSQPNANQAIQTMTFLALQAVGLRSEQQ